MLICVQGLSLPHLAGTTSRTAAPAYIVQVFRSPLNTTLRQCKKTKDYVFFVVVRLAVYISGLVPDWLQIHIRAIRILQLGSNRRIANRLRYYRHNLVFVACRHDCRADPTSQSEL